MKIKDIYFDIEGTDNSHHPLNTLYSAVLNRLIMDLGSKAKKKSNLQNKKNAIKYVKFNKLEFFIVCELAGIPNPQKYHKKLLKFIENET